MNENDYIDWLESQYTIDEIAEREQYEAEAYAHFQEIEYEQSPF